jgi:hypothetical protein
MTRRSKQVVIHVNQHVIRRNLKTGEREPPITVRRGRTVSRHSHVRIYGEDGRVAAEVVYSPDRPLSCGARVWISASGSVEAEDGE